jgi:hypothetical protein
VPEGYLNVSPKLRILDIGENQFGFGVAVKSCSLEKLIIDGNNKLMIEDFSS